MPDFWSYMSEVISDPANYNDSPFQLLRWTQQGSCNCSAECHPDRIRLVCFDCHWHSELVQTWPFWHGLAIAGAIHDAYNRGHQDGYQEGRDEGLIDGFSTGYEDGKIDGYDECEAGRRV
jgi:hypothetical protein